MVSPSLTGPGYLRGTSASTTNGPTGRVRRPSLLVFAVLDGVRVPQRAQALAGAAGLDVEQVAAQEVDVPVLERREAGDVLVLDVVALGAELDDGSVQVAGVPQDDGVEDEAEGGELVLLALAVRLADLAAAAVADRAGRGGGETPAR